MHNMKILFISVCFKAILTFDLCAYLNSGFGLCTGL